VQVCVGWWTTVPSRSMAILIGHKMRTEDQGSEQFNSIQFGVEIELN
jgi:hypothetical protein